MPTLFDESKNSIIPVTYDLEKFEDSPEDILFDEKVEAIYPAEIHMISGCRDSQVSVELDHVATAELGASFTSFQSSGGQTHQSTVVSINLAELRNTHFQLPKNIDGRTSGLCTKAFLSCVEEKKEAVSWFQLLENMNTHIRLEGHQQDPQLSSTRLIEVNQPFQLVKNKNGTKRAILIGINYVGRKGALTGCHDDVQTMAAYLEKNHGFSRKNMTILMDDDTQDPPTFRNIMRTFRTVVRRSKPGDTVFLHYCGHGGRIQDIDADERDGFDETIIPSDFHRAGQITDDEIADTLVKPMRRGVYMVALMDCCHSGTILDLPYVCTDGSDYMIRQKQLKLGSAGTKCCGLF